MQHFVNVAILYFLNHDIQKKLSLLIVKNAEDKLFMDKYKIIALFGKAGSGKDYIQKQIMKTIWGKIHLHEIISCTTRPPREGEIEGVHYHFIPTSAEFLNGKNLPKWIEFTCFRDWWYGTSIDHLIKNKINIGVFNINGIEQILKNENIECLPIKIICPDKIRLIRQLNREVNPDCLEICRRFQTDHNDFSSVPFAYKMVENSTNEIQPVITEILQLTREKWSN